MTFLDAKNELEKLANGKYYCLKYHYAGGCGLDVATCKVYIDGFGHTDDFPSWVEAVENMKKIMPDSGSACDCLIDKTQFPER